MYVATNRILVRKPHGPDLIELFKERGGLEQVSGFLRFELWHAKVEAEHEEFLVVSHWESVDAHKDWTQSEAFRRAHSGMRSDFIMGPGAASAYEVCLVSQASG